MTFVFRKMRHSLLFFLMFLNLENQSQAVCQSQRPTKPAPIGSTLLVVACHRPALVWQVSPSLNLVHNPHFLHFVTACCSENVLNTEPSCWWQFLCDLSLESKLHAGFVSWESCGSSGVRIQLFPLCLRTQTRHNGHVHPSSYVYCLPVTSATY